MVSKYGGSIDTTARTPRNKAPRLRTGEFRPSSGGGYEQYDGNTWVRRTAAEMAKDTSGFVTRDMLESARAYDAGSRGAGFADPRAGMEGSAGSMGTGPKALTPANAMVAPASAEPANTMVAGPSRYLTPKEAPLPPWRTDPRYSKMPPAKAEQRWKEDNGEAAVASWKASQNDTSASRLEQVPSYTPDDAVASATRDARQWSTDRASQSFILDETRRRFAQDPKALESFDRALQEGQAMVNAGTRSVEENIQIAASKGDHWLGMPPALRFLAEPIDFVVGSVPGLAPIAAAGVGVSTGFGSGAPTGTNAHPGMADPGRPGPNPAGMGNPVKAATDYVGQTTLAPVQGGAGASPVGPSTGVPDWQPTETPVYPTPTGAPVPGTPATGLAPAVNGVVTPGVVAGAAAAPVAPAAPAAPGSPLVTADGKTLNKDGTPQDPAGLDLLNPGMVAGAATLGAGVLGAKAATDAANTVASGEEKAAGIIAAAAQAGIELSREQFNALMAREKDVYNQQRLDTQPYRDYGTESLKELSTFGKDRPDFGMDQFKADPGYNFRLSEGIKALENSAAARGGLMSGNTMKGITEYGQGMASQEYQNAFNRYNSERGMRLNSLQSGAGLGQTAVQQVGNAGQNYAGNTGQASQNYSNSTGNAMLQGGMAQAGGATGAANARASGQMGAANAMTNMAGTLLNSYYQNQWMNQLMARK